MVILVIAILMVVAAPSFLGQTSKAQDSAAKQSLSIAWKAAKIASIDSPKQGSYASINAVTLGAIEPEMIFTDSNTNPTEPETINVAHINTDDIVLKGRSKSGKVCALTATMNGAPVMNCETIPDAPESTSSPVISGVVTMGQEMDASNGSWTGNPTSYAYQWRLCDSDGENCADIEDATSSSYTIPTGNSGQTLRIVVTATNAGGSTAAISDHTDVIVDAPSNTALPVISGTVRVNETLNVSNGSWSDNPTSYAYQWQSSSNGSTWTNLPDATNASYVVQIPDAGKTLRATVTATNIVGSTSVSTDATATVALAQFAVSSFAYTRDPADPTKINAVSFTVTPSAIATMTVTPLYGSTYSCVIGDGGATTCAIAPGITTFNGGIGMASPGYASNMLAVAEYSTMAVIPVSNLTPANCTSATYFRIVGSASANIRYESGHSADLNRIWLGTAAKDTLSAGSGYDCILPGGVPSGQTESILASTGTDFCYSGPGAGAYTFSSCENATRPTGPYTTITSSGPSGASNVVYTFDNTNPQNIASWSFDLSHSASVVYSRLSSSGTFTSCTHGSGTHWTCTPGTEPSVASTNYLYIYTSP